MKNKTMKKITAIMMAASMVFGMTACGGSGSESTTSTGEGSGSKSGDIKIAYIVKAKTDEFWTTMEKGAYAAA